MELKKANAVTTKLESENAEFRDRLAKVEQKQTLNDNTPNNNQSNFNSDTSLSKEPIPEVSPVSSKSSKETEIDVFLDEVQKKKVSDEIRQRNREKKLCFSASGQAQESLLISPEEKIGSEQDSKCKKGKSVNKLKQELFASELSSQEPSIEQNHVTEISETLCPRKVTSDKSSIDEASQHLAQLCDKAFDAEDKAN